jgi:DNA repair exonuclease SbcCD ATPase subunit
MFEPEGLRELWLEKENGQLNQVNGSPLELNELYRKEMTRTTGLASFEQLVFLQHFVLTFDERRHLLFWKQYELEQALHLAFGVDTETAKRADELRDKALKADSYGRNASWQANTIRKKVKELEEAVSGGTETASADIEADYSRLLREEDHAQKHVDELEAKLRDANLRVAHLSANQATLRSDYDSEFAKRLASVANIRHHPLIRTSLADGKCHLCGSQSGQIAKEIEQHIKSGNCPLCGAELTKQSKGTDLERLKELDKQLAVASKAFNEALNKVTRLQTEIARATSQRDSAVEALKQFTSENRKEIIRLESKASVGMRAMLDEYRRQIEQCQAEKSKRYKERDEYRAALRPLQQSLEQKYRAVEEVFVPMFKELAESFLGVDLNVVFELSKSTGAALVLDVKRDERRRYHQLSESQRFFVDIALRMALIKHMSAQMHPGCLYLDTPEGSLDIAYEARAGKMIAKFARDGFGCVMTANINTSQLLLCLAEGTDSSRMALLRMTSWAELSEVQIEEEESFDRAFKEIEKRIRQKPKK